MGIPGMTDIRLADDEGVDVPRPLGLPGDLANEDVLTCSGVIVEVEICIGPCLAGGCRDLAFAARAVARRAPSVAVLPDPPILVRPDPTSDKVWVDVVDAILGRRLCDALVVKSESITPGPIDLRGAFEEFVPDMGGYWLCRRVRIARGALGGSTIPEAAEVVEEMLL